MFSIKINAMKLIKGRILKLFGTLLSVPFIFICAFLAGFMVFSVSLFGMEAVFGYFSREIQTALSVLCVISCTVLLLFYFLFSFYSKAVFFSLSDDSSVSPLAVCSFRCAVRYMRCRFTVALYKLLWAIFFFSPAVITLLFTLSQIILSGEMIKSSFIALITACVIMLLGGAVFFFVVASRYFLTDYLLYISPMQPVREAVSSSVMLLRGRLIYVSLLRLYLAFSSVAAVVPLLLPRCAVLYRCMSVLACERLYGKRCIKNKAVPVVFYINRKSVFSSV